MKTIVHFEPLELDEVNHRVIYNMIEKRIKEYPTYPKVRRIVHTDDDGLPV